MESCASRSDKCEPRECTRLLEGGSLHETRDFPSKRRCRLMRFLVLGSAGQIGSYLMSFLQKNGHDVQGFDIVSSPAEDLRICPNFVLEERMKWADFVFFLAFDVGGAGYLEKKQDSYEFIHNNFAIMYNTFSSLKKWDKPFIFASSQMSNMMGSTYGVLKNLGERYTKSLGGMVVYFWNVYGIEGDPEKNHVITDFLLKAIRYGKIEMRTDGEEERQFLHAEDACSALEILALQYPTLRGANPWHITSFEWTKIRDLATIVANSVGNVKVSPSSRKDLVQLDKRNAPDTSILKIWQPQISLREGIDGLLNYYREKSGV